MSEFRMPALGADMEKGTVVTWHVKPGDVVHRGEVVADVETEKGTIEVEIWEDGTIESLLIEAGREVPVGTPLAQVRPLGESRLEPAPADTPVERSPRAAGGGGGELAAPPTEREASPSERVAAALAPVAAARPRRRLRASPLARKIAAADAVDLTRVEGSGPGGAVTRADVLRYEAVHARAPASEAAPTDVTAKAEAIRHAIAQAMGRSKREIPHYYLQNDVNMARALAWLAEVNRPPQAVGERVLPVALGLKAVARALREFPDLNGFFVEGRHRPQPSVHLGVGIALRAGGLVAPAIRDADGLSLTDSMRRLMDLIARSRAGKLRGSEVTSATATVTSLGDQGVDSVYGVIHPPQVALVGMGRIRERPWAERGMIGAVPVMTMTLSADHRASDGHRGTRFLSLVARLLQSPEAL